ncbi:transmembrane protein 104-like isoform X2 [Dysidea avara]
MAAANAWSLGKESSTKKIKAVQQNPFNEEEVSDNFSESFPLILDQDIPEKGFEIVKKFEMAQMADMFFNTLGVILYYLCICIYLYGDLAIYAVAVPKSMRTVVCPDYKGRRYICNESNDTLLDYGNSSGCEGNWTWVGRDICMGSLSYIETYYVFLAVFTLLLCPWTFFNVQKTKILQIVTTITRNLAFIMMIVLALIEIIQGNRVGPKAFDFKELPNLFGICIYAFMCQHSLPGMITPMKSKKYVYPMLAADYGLILLFYLVMCYTAVYRFGGKLEDIYTLNFIHDTDVWSPLSYYLALFPVFTLSTNFPIISVTLRENLKVLGRKLVKGKEYPFVVDRIVFPLLAVIPPIAIAYGTTNVEILVSLTGSFPGVGVQYVIPVALAYFARRKFYKQFHSYKNKHKSPISFVFVFVAILVWAAASIIMIIVDDILKILQ